MTSSTENIISNSAMESDLPPPGTQRWVPRRKAAVVSAVRKGVLSREQAVARYQLTDEEFGSWERALDSHGVRGLRTTRLQQYRGVNRVPGQGGQAL